MAEAGASPSALLCPLESLGASLCLQPMQHRIGTNIETDEGSFGTSSDDDTVSIGSRDSESYFLESSATVFEEKPLEISSIKKGKEPGNGLLHPLTLINKDTVSQLTCVDHRAIVSTTNLCGSNESTTFPT